MSNRSFLLLFVHFILFYLTYFSYLFFIDLFVTIMHSCALLSSCIWIFYPGVSIGRDTESVVVVVVVVGFSMLLDNKVLWVMDSIAYDGPLSPSSVHTSLVLLLVRLLTPGIMTWKCCEKITLVVVDCT